jgi:fructose-1,6-bisphosphatase II
MTQPTASRPATGTNLAPPPAQIDRNLALELARVTEAGALSAGRWMGRGDKEAGDQAAVDAMRRALSLIAMEGVVVIGEGEKDHAPMLYIGERLGTGGSPALDIAVDPIDGTTLLAKGLPNALSIVALAERGSMYYPPHIVYMEKIAVGPDAAGAININDPPARNLERIAEAKNQRVQDLTVVILDRPRHAELTAAVRATGARIRLISDGDVAGAIMCATDDSGVDVLMGVGGTTEAVLAACAMQCLGGELQCKLWPRDDDERRRAIAAGVANFDKVFMADDLVRSEDIFFAATGITDGEVLKGVTYHKSWAETESLVTRSRSGTVRRIQARHHYAFKRRSLEPIKDSPP